MQHFTASDGAKIAYCIDDFTDPWHSPPVVIMLHAALGHAQRYYGWVPHLARHYRVVRMDLRGHGQSEVPAAEPPLTMDRLVQDVVDMMDHLDLDTAHFVGNSAGGYVAQNLAMSAPSRVTSLSLFGSSPGLKNSQAATWLPQVAEKGIRIFMTETIDDRFVIDQTDPGLIEWFIDESAKNDPEYIVRFIGLMTTLDWSDRLSEIGCPTLLVVPGAETVGSGEIYDVMRDRIPDATLLTYDGLPHNIGEAAPDRCAQDVFKFLQERFGD